LEASNGEIVATGESYPTLAGVKKGIEAARVILSPIAMTGPFGEVCTAAWMAGMVGRNQRIPLIYVVNELYAVGRFGRCPCVVSVFPERFQMGDQQVQGAFEDFGGPVFREQRF